jgi:hypothetical protein
MRETIFISEPMWKLDQRLAVVRIVSNSSHRSSALTSVSSKTSAVARNTISGVSLTGQTIIPFDFFENAARDEPFARPHPGIRLC